MSGWRSERFWDCRIRSTSWRSQFDYAALALDPRQGNRATRRWPPDRIERSHALGIVRVLRTPDCAAGILGSRRGAAAARSHYHDFRPMGRATHRPVHVPTKRQARGLVPEVRLLAALPTWSGFSTAKTARWWARSAATAAMRARLHWIDAVAIDSKGNVYTGEVEDGKRIQKFVPAK